MITLDEARLLSDAAGSLLRCMHNMAECELTTRERKLAETFLDEQYQELGRLSLHPMPLTSLSLVIRDLDLLLAWFITKRQTEPQRRITPRLIALEDTLPLASLLNQPHTFYGEQTDPEQTKQVPRKEKTKSGKPP